MVENIILVSSVCISKNGSMIWNYTDRALLTMKKFSEEEALIMYLSKISVMRPYIHTMFIKLRVKEKTYFQI